MKAEKNGSLSPASIWILKKFIDLEKILEESVSNYELAHAIDGLYKFLWDDFADWYIEYLKTDESQTNFAKDLFKQYIIILSPYSPFETEVLWSQFFGQTSLLALEVKDKNWSKKQIQSVEMDSSGEFEKVVGFINDLRSLRGLFAIDPANLIEIYSESKILLHYKNFVKLVGRGEIISELKPEFYAGSSSDVKFNIDIFKYIKDIQAELARTDKLKLQLQKQILDLENQLANSKFVENAESNIIEEKRESLEQRKRELSLQQDKIQMLTKSKS